MGAIYEMFVSAASTHVEVQSSIRNILEELGWKVVCCARIGDNVMRSDSVVLLGPIVEGRQQVVIERRIVDVGISQWYAENPIGLSLSRAGHTTLHIWSYDSGLVAGLGIYLDGLLVARSTRVSGAAGVNDVKGHGLELPETIENGRSGLFQKAAMEFNQIGDPLEKGIAAIVSSLGFSVHLVDIRDAVDDGIGIAVENRQYVPKSLRGWIAIEVAPEK